MASNTEERVLKAWDLHNLESILGAGLSPPSFSDNLRKHLASLAKIVTLEEARRLLREELNGRLQDRSRCRGVARHFITDVDVKRVLMERQSSQQHPPRGASAAPEPTTPSDVVEISPVAHPSMRPRAATAEPTCGTVTLNHREAPPTPSTHSGRPPVRTRPVPASFPPERTTATPTAPKTHAQSITPSTTATPLRRGLPRVSTGNMSTPPTRKQRGGSTGTDVALKFKRKRELMRAEMDDDLEDLQLRLEEAEMAIKMTQRRLHKANESFNNAMAQRDAIAMNEDLDARIGSFSTLQTELASLRVTYSQTLEEDVGADGDDGETPNLAGSTDQQPMPVAHHVDNALAQIAHAIKTLEANKTGRQELAAAAEVEISRAEAHLNSMEEELKRAKERVHKCQVEHDEAQEVRRTLEE